MRRVLKPLSSVLLVVGALLLADAIVTLVWQEPVSALYAKLEQGRLDDDLAKLEGTEPTATDRKVLSHLGTLDRKLAYASRALNRAPTTASRSGASACARSASTRWSSPGRTPRACGAGPATTPARRCRARAGTVAIAGHRTTYGAPFRRLDKLSPGDRIEVSMPYGRFVYAVERRGSCRRRRPGSPSACATTGSCCRPATRCIRPPSGS